MRRGAACISDCLHRTTKDSCGATYAGMPQQFAYPAALGDLLAAVLAVVAIPAVAVNARSARPLVWIFNIEGTLDLIAAIALATLYDAAAYMGPRILDPGVLDSSPAGNALYHVHCPQQILETGRLTLRGYSVVAHSAGRAMLPQAAEQRRGEEHRVRLYS
ncbi:MAG: hypothetical protein A2010_04735 [Nitrospirae bacterium GWD2_57_9]|nr:MAG: hypothetical protein A2010_04735 [Nitrospirae bacterium GWD2_57_9]